MGVVFFSAAVYRMFNYGAGIEEFNLLKIPVIFLPLSVLFELIVGTLFLLNKKLACASLTSIIFLSVAIVVAVLTNFREVLNSIPQLFVFKANSVDILLHALYVFLLFLIYFQYKTKKKRIVN